MATQEQIEAVARAIDDAIPSIDTMARAAVRAYEATRPAVTDDREREALAQRVASAVRGPNWGNQTTMDDARIAVDVVLAALGDRLLPELPVGPLSIHLASTGTGNSDWGCQFVDADGETTLTFAPTIAAAIREAVSEGDDE